MSHTRPQTVLLLTTSYPRSPGDPAGAFVAGFARAFQSQGWAVHVLAPADEEGGSGAAAPRSEQDGRACGREEPGITVERVRQGPSCLGRRLLYGAGAPENLSAAPWLLLQAPPFLAALGCRTRQLAPRVDLVVGHWLLPGGLVAAWARGRTPCAAVCHSGGLWLLEQLPAREQLAGCLLRRCRRLLFVGGHLLERFARLVPAKLQPLLQERACVLPMGVDAPPPLSADDRRLLRGRLGLRPEAPVLLFLGRFVPIKGVEDLLAAAEGLALQLVLAGGGPERARWQALAAARGLDCRFTGWVSGEVKDAWLQAADALVLPSRDLGSRSEGTPVVALEALAAGLPVIASAVGGLPEVVWSGVNGLLVPDAVPGEQAGDRVKRWRQALVDLAGDPERWSALRQAAARSGQGYRWPVLGPEMVRLLTVD